MTRAIDLGATVSGVRLPFCAMNASGVWSSTPSELRALARSETGAIGAGLVSIAIIMAAFRMPQPRVLGVAGFLAAALAGQFMAVALVSFDLWNDWWWSCAGLLSAMIVVMFRAETIDQPSRILAAESDSSSAIGTAP